MKAKPLGKLDDAIAGLGKRLDSFLARSRKIANRKPRSIADAISVLRELRGSIYEELNQLQHEYLALTAVGWLIENDHCPASTEWYCHLQQTSAEGETDLIGKHGGRFVIWAEICAAENPKGIIDGRIRDALATLHAKPKSSKKFYFVRSSTMQARAEYKRLGIPDCKVRVVKIDL